VQRSQLVNRLNELLKPHLVNDYCPNGLQVEGSENVSRIVTGVTASMALIDQAITQDADTILVHHGYFWKGETPALVGMKQKRIKKLLAHNINLFAYHLPIDIHPQLGNNVQLGKILGLHNIQAVNSISPIGIVMQGELSEAQSLSQICERVQSSLARKPMSIDAGEHLVKKLAWCTGGGQNYIDQLVDQGIDAFLSGEISEQTVHSAREQNIHYISAGHHATERYGVKAVGEWLASEYNDLHVAFVDVENPA